MAVTCPHAGLDARAAAIVMRAVRNTVNTGRTVVCTIHQPSIEIFESFDELLVRSCRNQGLGLPVEPPVHEAGSRGPCVALS